MQLPKITQIIFEMFGIFYLYFGLFSAVNALPDFQDGDIRLIGGRTENEGTVVIYHDGRWGSICDRGWDIRDGNVACHQLGFHRALQSLRRSPYGPGRTHRWLTGLRCGGRELRLDQCRPRRWGIERDERHCQQYSRSAAVVCMPRTVPSTSSSTTTTTKATTKSQATSTTERPSTKQIATTSKPTTIAPKTLFVENNIPTVKTILEEDIDEDNKEKHAISERYSNRSIIYDENNNNENVIPDPSVTNNRQISYRLQYDAQWSDTRRTKDIETSPTTEKPSTTTKKPPSTTKKPSSTPAAPAPRFRYEEEVYSINLPMRRWVKDPLLKCWVLATVRGKILVAKPGRRPKRITKEEYYERRRNELEAQRGIEDVSNEITTRSPLNDASETHGNVVNNRIADPVRSRTTTKQTTITTKKPTTTRKPRTTTVKLTPKPTTLKTTIKSTTTTTTTPKPRTPKPTTPKPTTMKPTTPKPTTMKPTTMKPTTPKPTTMKPTTPKPTSMKPTTTTTPKPTPAPAPADTNDDEVYALKLVKSKWIKDDDLGLWVMLSRSGKVLIAKPGQRSKKVTEDEYYQMRREKIRETQSHDRMKSDDPSPGQESGRAPAPRTRLLPIGTGGNIINGNASDLSVSSNFMIGSDLNTSRNGNPHMHGSRIGNRHRHRHGSGKMKMRLAGRRANRGKIEILPRGREEWGVICGDHWTIRETMVACRDLGLGYGQQQITKAIYGGNDQKKYYSRVRCKGNEKRMSDCEWVEHEGPVQCSSRDSVAGVICTSALPDLEPSIYMLETTTFLQDRHLYYLQCAMEENCLAPSANEAKLSRYWRQSTRRLLRFSSVVKNIGTADFKPMTDRSQWEWHACHMHYHSMDVFAHYDIMDLNGNRVAEGLKASFCLEDSACNPGIFPKYSCQNYGQQGISVGCSDNYMADIDCQWVDITDLKPGDYIFKVEVNPKMLVAEISYDNNAVICNLEYTGYYAKLSECKLTSLL